MAKLVYPLEGEGQPVTRCGRALSMPWQLMDEGAPPRPYTNCLACSATGTE
jgi:hypothetical protein